MARIMEDMGKIHGITPLDPLPAATPSTSARPQGCRTPLPRKAKTKAPNYAANPLKPAAKRKPKPKRKRSQEEEEDTDSTTTDDQREALIQRAKTLFKPTKKKRDSKSPGNGKSIKSLFKPVLPPVRPLPDLPADPLSPIHSPNP